MSGSKAVLVTGAAKRLGRAVSLGVGKHCWGVAIHYNNSESDAQETAALIRGMNRNTALLEANLGNENEVTGLIGRATAKLGPLAALVNCASIFERGEWATVPRAPSKRARCEC